MSAKKKANSGLAECNSSGRKTVELGDTERKTGFCRGSGRSPKEQDTRGDKGEARYPRLLKEQLLDKKKWGSTLTSRNHTHLFVKKKSDEK